MQITGFPYSVAVPTPAEMRKAEIQAHAELADRNWAARAVAKVETVDTATMDPIVFALKWNKDHPAARQS